MLPELNLEPKPLEWFLDKFQSYIKEIRKADNSIAMFEKKKLVRLLTNEAAVCTIDIIWSKESLQGQAMGNLSGQIQDVLPSRLRALAEKNKAFEKHSSPVFPKHGLDAFKFALNLSFVQELLRRPGGQKAKNVNKSQKLTELK